MVVSKVVISLAVYRCCLEHALSTEKEEVMGLLIGKLESPDKTKLAEGENIYGDIIRFEATKNIRRRYKRRDRVEIPVEQLVFGVQRAEAIEKMCKRPNGLDPKDYPDSKKLRILGWYHSHPHITVWPSHVDLATQYNYQGMDENFVGIIFSIFNDDGTSKTSCFEVTCFQTHRGVDGDMSRISIPIEIEQTSSLMSSSSESSSLRRLIESERLELPATLHEEEVEAYKVATVQQVQNNGIAVITAHTEALNVNVHAPTNLDRLALVKNDIALKLGHARLFEYVTIPLLEQKQMELEIKRAQLRKIYNGHQKLQQLTKEYSKANNGIVNGCKPHNFPKLADNCDRNSKASPSRIAENGKSQDITDDAIVKAISNAKIDDENQQGQR